MPNLFSLAEQALTSESVETKLALAHEAWRCHQHGDLFLDSNAVPPQPTEAARFPERPVLVDPRELPRRKLTSKEGRVALLHAVAHIEFSAIQLAFDHLYRFRAINRSINGVRRLPEIRKKNGQIILVIVHNEQTKWYLRQ